MRSSWWNSRRPTPTDDGDTTMAPASRASLHRAAAADEHRAHQRLAERGNADPRRRGIRRIRRPRARIPAQADVHGDDRSLVPLRQHVDREVGEHAAVDEEALLVSTRREEARDAHRRHHGRGELPGPVDVGSPCLEVGAHAAERARQLLDVDAGQASAQRPLGLAALHHRHGRYPVVVVRVVADELLVAEVGAGLRIEPARVDGRDDGPLARPGDPVDDDARRLELHEDAEMGERAGAAPAHHDPH